MPCRDLRLVLTACGLLVACAPSEVQTADPEAASLSPSVIIVEEPEPDPEQVEAEQTEDAEAAEQMTKAAKDEGTEVITFHGEDADPGMADQVTGSPTREKLPSMMSDIINGPNK